MRRAIGVMALAVLPALSGAALWGAALWGAAPSGAAPSATAPNTQPTTRVAAIVDPRLATVIAFLERRTQKDSGDITALNRLSGDYRRRFIQTGDDADLVLAEKAAALSLKSVSGEANAGGLSAIAHAAFSLHRFTEVRDDAIKLLSIVPDKRYPLDLLGDASLELGDYDKAAEAYEKMEKFGMPDPGSEARLARLAIIHGDLDAARKHFAAAVDYALQLFEPDPTVTAWCYVQAGQLEYMTGHWAAAEADYEQALKQSPTDWGAIDHMAELRAGQKRYDEAIGLYTRLVARVPRPELMQSLGDVYTVMGNADMARTWHHRAVKKYTQAAASGSVHYYHHLAGYYCDIEPDPVAALHWAQMDMKVRHSVYAYDSLAWALYQGGDFKAASAAMDKALAMGTRDSHLLYHASLIYHRAGDVARARDCLRRAAEVNPQFMEFHVHR